ncbi:hypothetical protein LX32DRAFT_637819 [Colletotrichum zoysiae]|uniref:Uncharacterized protein n=1 Tax=Colletotrichum zoysiae TaxID=1216348 RepID=A0AAD9M6P4_9PEZI|nr:hypothetical protein LX32DRAFT_637819 [Colletotrichum zoysiae]
MRRQLSRAGQGSSQSPAGPGVASAASLPQVGIASGPQPVTAGRIDTYMQIGIPTKAIVVGCDEQPAVVENLAMTLPGQCRDTA